MKTSEDIEIEWQELERIIEDLETEVKLARKESYVKYKEWRDAKDRENEETIEINAPE